jgi:hypothetical protein
VLIEQELKGLLGRLGTHGGDLSVMASRWVGEIKQRSSKRGKQPPPAIANEHANPYFIGIHAQPPPPTEPQTAFASRRSPVRSRLAP